MKYRIKTLSHCVRWTFTWAYWFIILSWWILIHIENFDVFLNVHCLWIEKKLTLWYFEKLWPNKHLLVLHLTYGDFRLNRSVSHLLIEGPGPINEIPFHFSSHFVVPKWRPFSKFLISAEVSTNSAKWFQCNINHFSHVNDQGTIEFLNVFDEWYTWEAPFISEI